MNINCTVIIQICNFFIAWIILERVLLRTVLEKLTSKKKAEADFWKLIEQDKQEIVNLKDTQKKLWYNLNKYCLQNIPSLKKTDSTRIAETYVPTDEIDTQSVDTLSKNYAICITEWLKDPR